MAQEISCPVCGFDHIQRDKEQCPQCDADLTCFKVLDSLPDSYPVAAVNAPESRKILFIITWILVGLVGVLSVLHLFDLRHVVSDLSQVETWFEKQGNHAPDPAIKLHERLLGLHERLLDQLPTRRNEFAVVSGHAETAAASKPPLQLLKIPAEYPASVELKNIEPAGSEEKAHNEKNADIAEFFIYHAHAKDTLWNIAEKQYGSGEYYPVLLEHNPHISIYGVGDGVRIKVLKDAEIAGKTFTRIIQKKGNKVYWDYMTRDGDTLKSVAGKFSRSESFINRIIDLNPDIKLQPGNKITIVLE
ncbi:MAG: LysM peptidoglycan-binding domain-containing protein [Thermodesulfobacteriota bacterium]|nr:LysM peptidoglycan-binding domain-containing protein [Thermodesulfobacteriota bacterium]